MQRALTISIGLVLLTLVAYEPVRSAGFVNLDDRVYVTQNPPVLGGLTADGIAWALRTGYAANWHPLTWMSHMLDVSLFGLEPLGHHATNVVLHAAGVVLLFLLVRRMTDATWKSAFVAAAFAVHPLHVESVAWVSERKDVLSALFGILALWAWVDWTRRGGAGRWIASIAGYALGLASKPMLVTFPFLLLLLDVWPLRRREIPFRRLVVEKLPFFALAAASSIVTMLVQSRGQAVAESEALPLLFRLANAACACVDYLGNAIWPDDLAVFYPYARQQSISKSLVCAAFLVGTSIAALVQARARPWFFVGWFWWLGMLVPVIGIVQVGRQSMADRYMHLPIVGLAIAFAWGIGELAERRRVVRALASAVSVALVLGWTLLSRAQAATWKDDFALFGRAVAVTERNDVAHRFLGTALAEAGRNGEALEQFRLSIAANPMNADAHNQVGRILQQQGRLTEAIEDYRRAVEIDPGHQPARRNLAYALDLDGRADEALEQYEETLRRFPANADLRVDFALALLRRERFADAADELRRAIALRPDLGEAHLYLGQALANLDRLPEAIESVREGVRLLPDRLDAREVLEGMLREQAQSERVPR